jgi:hypothetical protein
MEQKTEIKIPHLSAPVDYADFLDKILSAMYALTKPSSSKEIQGKDSKLADSQSIGRGASYLVYLGLATEKGHRGKFELSDKGRTIEVEKVQGKGEEANRIWAKVLSEHPLYGFIGSYISEKGGGIQGSSIGLAEYLRQLRGANWSSAFIREGGKRLCRLYASKGLLSFDADKDVITLIALTAPPQVVPDKSGQTQSLVKPFAQVQQVPVGVNQSVVPSSPSYGLTTNVSIEISIDAKDDTSVSNLIDLIRALRGEKVERTSGKPSKENSGT